MRYFPGNVNNLMGKYCTAIIKSISLLIFDINPDRLRLLSFKFTEDFILEILKKKLNKKACKKILY